MGTIEVSDPVAEPERTIYRVFLVLTAFRSAFRSRADLILENLALGQQLAAFAQSGRRPRILATDRLLWTALRRLWSRWVDLLVFVKPETVVRWHRAGFRCYWTWLSRHRGRGRPSIHSEIHALIRRIASEPENYRRTPRLRQESHARVHGKETRDEEEQMAEPSRPGRPA